MIPTERVAVRLTPDTVAVLDTLVRSGEFSSMSDVVMAALREFIDSRFKAEDIHRILEDASKKKAIDPESLIAPSDTADLDEAIKAAVSGYVRDRIEQR
jgi:Arc/MetJ-type ribon-helix-helix transcriptional regulator